MALSNLTKEPRREVIEQSLGIAAFAFYIWADYAFIRWLGAVKTGDLVFGMLLGFVSIPMVGLLLFMMLLLAHAVGEGVCALCARAGFDPRPTRRYR